MKEKKRQRTTAAWTRRLFPAPNPRRARADPSRPEPGQAEPSRVPTGRRTPRRHRPLPGSLSACGTSKPAKSGCLRRFWVARSCGWQPWGTQGVTVSPVISFHSLSSETEPKASPAQKKESTNPTDFTGEEGSALFFPMSQLGGLGAAGSVGFFSPPLQPLCMFDPWHLPCVGRGKGFTPLPSHGGCKRQPKCVPSALGNFRGTLKKLAASASLKVTPDVQGKRLRAPSKRHSRGWCWKEKALSSFPIAPQLPVARGQLPAAACPGGVGG